MRTRYESILTTVGEKRLQIFGDRTTNPMYQVDAKLQIDLRGKLNPIWRLIRLEVADRTAKLIESQYRRQRKKRGCR